MDNIERPAPIGEAQQGPTYDIAEVAAYRKIRMVSQIDLSAHMRVGQPYVSMVESHYRRANSKAKVVEKMLDAIDYLAGKRERMRQEGIAELEAIRKTRARKAGRA